MVSGRLAIAPRIPRQEHRRGADLRNGMGRKTRTRFPRRWIVLFGHLSLPV